MKKLIYLIVIIVAFALIVTGCIPVVPPTEQNVTSGPTKGPSIYVDDESPCPGAGTEANPYCTIQAAINAATIPGEIIMVAAGNYPEKLNINKSLSIIGESRDSVIINASSFSSGYGISVTANNVTLEYFTLEGPTHAGGYGIHTSGCNNITFENLLVENSGRSGVDFIGCNTITINNVEAKNNGGVGIAITDSNIVAVSNITTSGNTWAGMAVFTDGEFHVGGCDNIVLTGANSFGEPGPFYTETGKDGNGADYPITNLNVSGDFQYIMRFPLSGPQKTAFFPTLIYALGAGAYLVSLGAVDAVVNDVITETPLDDYGTYYVGPGMIIQSAINAASSGNTIIVATGTYNEEVIVDKPLTLEGVNAGIPGTGARGAESIVDPPGDDIGWEAGFFITSGDVTIDGFKIIGADEAIHVDCIADRENVVIKNNYIDTSTGVPDTGIAATGIIFCNFGWLYGSNSVNGAVVEANYIYQGHDKDAIWFQDVEGSITINQNKVEGHSLSAIILGGSGPYGSNVDLSGTAINNNEVDLGTPGSGNAIRLKRVISPSSAISITGNKLTGAKHGIYITNGSEDTNISAHTNNLEGNPWGIRSKVSATMVNARANWWGDKSGPTYSGNPDGIGVKVSDYVLYKPWLKKALPKW